MKKIIFFFIFFFNFTTTYAEIKIVYIDITSILNKSLVGESLNKHVSSIKSLNINKFKELEKNLIEKEKDLTAQKNIIEKTEYSKKFNKLKLEIENFKIELKKSQDEINKIKVDNTKKIINILNPIIKRYVEENSISLVLPKKNIIVGKKNLDITESIIKLLNSEIKVINF